MEGIPEITVNITSSCLDFLVVHPCVLEGDTHVQIPSFQPSQMLKGPGMVGRKVRFRPPTESFHLCHYSSKTPYGLPVRGIYQMQVRGVRLVVGTVGIRTEIRSARSWGHIARTLSGDKLFRVYARTHVGGTVSKLVYTVC